MPSHRVADIASGVVAEDRVTRFLATARSLGCAAEALPDTDPYVVALTSTTGRVWEVTHPDAPGYTLRLHHAAPDRMPVYTLTQPDGVPRSVTPAAATQWLAILARVWPYAEGKQSASASNVSDVWGRPLDPVRVV